MNFKKNKINLYKWRTGIIFFAFFFFVLHSNFAHSATADELKDQIQKITDTKAQLQKEIDAYELQLKDLGAQSNSLSNTIKSLNATVNKNALDIKLTQKSVDSTQLQIEQLALNIGKNVNTINKDTQAIALLLNEVNKYDSASFIENLLMYKDLSEFWNEEQNISLTQNKIQEKISETKDTKVILENNKTQAENKKADLLKLKSNLTDQKKILAITKSEKDKLLAETKNSETNYKKLLADKKALADAFDKELQLYESQLKSTVDKSTIPPSENGILSWPLDLVKITQKFGMTDFAKSGYYNGAPHNGVDFKASIGTPVKTVSGGIIRGIGDTDTVCSRASFGKWVFVEHNNGLSTIYAHLSLIKVSVGQIVTTRDVIGYSGNTGNSTGPHLHISLYASDGVEISDYKSQVKGCGTYRMPVLTKKGSYLDPLAYLPRL